MLFNAVVINFPSSTFFKILPIMQSVHLLLSERSYTLVGRNTVTRQSEPISVTEGCPINLPRDAGSYSGQRVQFVNKRAYFFQKGHVSF